ncbi:MULTISPECIES: protoglobin domain-containing protein [Viridibacillus]|uniref:protoglobin domain-containing protein n=1 Tax=Viridibacillus TaxID=496496 RepID=UPI0034CEB467
MESIVAKFYENLEKENSLGKIINQNSSIISLRTALKGHISEIFNGHIDKEFMKKRYKLAFVHAKVGFEPVYECFPRLTQCLFLNCTTESV